MHTQEDYLEIKKPLYFLKTMKEIKNPYIPSSYDTHRELIYPTVSWGQEMQPQKSYTIILLIEHVAYPQGESISHRYMNPEPDYTVYESNYICTDRL